MFRHEEENLLAFMNPCKLILLKTKLNELKFKVELCSFELFQTVYLLVLI